jgi:hypothetical protein
MNPTQHPGYDTTARTIQDRFMKKLKDSGGITIEPGTGALQLSSATSGKKKNLDIMQEVLHELKQEDKNIHARKAAISWWAAYTKGILVELTNPKSENYNQLFEGLMTPDGFPAEIIRSPGSTAWDPKLLMLELERRGKANGVDLAGVYGAMMQDDTRVNEFVRNNLTPRHPSIAAINHEMFGDNPKSYLQQAVGSVVRLRGEVADLVNREAAGSSAVPSPEARLQQVEQQLRQDDEIRATTSAFTRPSIGAGSTLGFVERKRLEKELEKLRREVGSAQ